MPREDLLALAGALLTVSVASETAEVYTDEPVFPRATMIEGPADEDTSFPGWGGEVLVLAYENQGVCAWGLALDGEFAGSVVVGGDLSAGKTTVAYAESLEEYIDARRWDRTCLRQEPLLQAQAGALDQHALDAISSAGRALTSTHGWPYAVNRRFEVGDLRIMLWADSECCDWWISGPEHAVRARLPMLVTLSDLRTTLWSNDARGIRLLDDLEFRD